MAKRNVSEIETGAGFFMGFVNAMMDVVREEAIPFAAVYRLATAGGRKTLSSMVDLAYTDWQAEQSKPAPQQSQGCYPISDARADGKALPPNHYRVRVNRGPLPPMATLEEMYSKNGVSDPYDGSYTWTKDRSRMGANDVTADEVVMVAKRFTAEEVWEMGGLTTENIIVWGIRNNLVAADEKETHAFGINPETRDLQCSRRLVGLGSSAMYDDDCSVAMLNRSSLGRILDFHWVADGYASDFWFLFVLRK